MFLLVSIGICLKIKFNPILFGKSFNLFHRRMDAQNVFHQEKQINNKYKNKTMLFTQQSNEYCEPVIMRTTLAISIHDKR